MADAPDSGSSASWRNPNRWQEDQWAFRQEFAKDPSGFDRTPVFFRWWTRRTVFLGGLGLGAIAWAVEWITRLIRETTPARLVALYQPDTPAGAPPFLSFEVFDDAFGQPASGEGEGIIVGEPIPNGTLLLEVDGQVILPRWNPTTEIRDAPAR